MIELFSLLAVLLATCSLSASAFTTTPGAFRRVQQRPAHQQHPTLTHLNESPSTQETSTLERLVQDFEKTVQSVESTVSKTCKVRPALIPLSPDHRLGLVTTQSISKGDVLLSMPYADCAGLTADLARKTFKGVLPEKYDGWTGESGLVALQLLNELALAATETETGTGAGIVVKDRSNAVQSYLASWVTALPHVEDCASKYPLLWPEEDQEVIQSSSNTKLYRILDDIEEDANWLMENIFTNDNKSKFPDTVILDGREYPCFSVKGFTWAMTMVQSRSFFLDKAVRLIPFMDMANHDDEANEIRAGFMGTFGTIKGALLVADRSYEKGEEVFCSYGPKSAIDYLLEHGFVPEQCWRTNISELTLKINPEDRFYDDKLDILEFETYEQAPMDPTQSFDVVGSGVGEPDPAMVQFVRLAELGRSDAFLLESIFRKEAWGFMSYPVSEQNELAVVNAITKVCQIALDDFDACPKGGPEICKNILDSERIALQKMMVFLKRDKEALDLKEYYQERRLKDLGLDSDWSLEDDSMGDPDLGFGQTRLPGGADYDW